ncbi:uncharacterized protein BDV17DRAFT_289952 [Aspergillus undulatus]|uniref:uncharacterized protein n=1 Tax=Aspergillus undulatus TaxID=1810928 RepID=UPI003CCDC17F
MELPYHSKGYTLRAPPRIPPRPGTVPVSGSYDRAPPLPPRPSFVNGDRPPVAQAQSEPSPYDYQSASYQEQVSALYPPVPRQSDSHHGKSTQQNGLAYIPQPPSWNTEQYDSPPPPRAGNQARLPSSSATAIPGPTKSAAPERPLDNSPPHVEPCVYACTSRYEPLDSPRELPEMISRLSLQSDHQLPSGERTPVPAPLFSTNVYAANNPSSQAQNTHKRPDLPQAARPGQAQNQRHSTQARAKIQYGPPARRWDMVHPPTSPRVLRLVKVVEFFSQRLNLSVRTCPGEEKGVAASEGVKWFQLNVNSHGRLSELFACEACYEDVLLASPIRDEFVQCMKPQPSDALWACDVAVPFIRKLVLKADLGTFIAEAARHLDLPPCAKGGEMVDLSSRRWYQPRPEFTSSGEEVTICERCYNNFMFHNDFKNHFQLVSPHPHSYRQRRCIMGLYQPRTVWEEALAYHDLSLWHRTMTAFVQQPPCTFQIAPGTQIYQIPGVENFDVCQSCYVGLIQPHGLNAFFQPSRIPASAVNQHACDLNPSHPLFAKYAHRLDEALITGTFSIFADFVSRISRLPPCPKLDLVKGRKWYGLPGCRICLACYEEVVRDAYLSQFFPSTPETLPPNADGEEGIHCDMYSPRMRHKWTESCVSQNPSIFFNFAHLRKQIYDQTVPEMRRLVMQAKLDLNMQKMHNTMSTFYNAMNGASAWQYNPYIRYVGGGVGGSFRTPWGVTGAQEGNQAWGYMTGVSGMNARVTQLQGMWDAVE